MMQDYALQIKAGIVGVAAFFTTIWGSTGWLVVAWIACMAMDYISGSLAAKKDGTWTSAQARSGLAGKGGMILFVLGAATLDAVLGLGLGVFPSLELPFELSAPITTLVLAWYILTEIGSLFENAQKLGAALPPGLQTIIDTLKKSIFKSDDNK